MFTGLPALLITLRHPPKHVHWYKNWYEIQCSVDGFQDRGISALSIGVRDKFDSKTKTERHGYKPHTARVAVSVLESIFSPIAIHPAAI